MARWFHDFARQHGGFDAELADLADFKPPICDEPVHPRMQPHEHEHTQAWSRSMAADHAYGFVMSESNHFPPPGLVNALDHACNERNHKPCGLVGYGGGSGGLRAVQMARLQATTLKVMPMVECAAVPMVASLLTEDGRFGSNALIDASARSLLDELLRWAVALQPMRA